MHNQPPCLIIRRSPDPPLQQQPCLRPPQPAPRQRCRQPLLRRLPAVVSAASFPPPPHHPRPHLPLRPPPRHPRPHYPTHAAALTASSQLRARARPHPPRPPAARLQHRPPHLIPRSPLQRRQSPHPHHLERETRGYKARDQRLCTCRGRLRFEWRQRCHSIQVEEAHLLQHQSASTRVAGASAFLCNTVGMQSSHGRPAPGSSVTDSGTWDTKGYRAGFDISSDISEHMRLFCLHAVPYVSPFSAGVDISPDTVMSANLGLRHPTVPRTLPCTGPARPPPLFASWRSCPSSSRAPPRGQSNPRPCRRPPSCSCPCCSA